MPVAEEQTGKTRRLVESALRDHESALVHYTSGLLNGDWERARDIVQDAFLKLCQQDPDSVANGVKSWLYTVCRNRTFDFLRRNRRWISDDDSLARMHHPAPDPAEEAGARDAGREVLDCLQALPQNCQDVVLLRFQQSMSYKEIAAITGYAEGQVAFLLHDAMKRLRGMLEARRKKESAQGAPP